MASIYNPDLNYGEFATIKRMTDLIMVNAKWSLWIYRRILIQILLTDKKV